MSLTQGRIDRAGKVVFHDASLSVWEEGISDARNAGGYAGAQQWEREFKRDVFARIVQKLNRLGWSVGEQTYIFTGNNSRYCTKGDLQADLKLCGRYIEFQMFQSVNAPDRPDHGGRYQYDKAAHMPYMLRLEMERTRRAIRDYLLNVFTGYVFTPEKPSKGPDGLTALEWVKEDARTSWHYKADIDRRGGEESSYNNRSADGAIVRHGEKVWFADSKGRIVTGVAHYNINNMWWVITGRYEARNVSSGEIYANCPDNLRLKRNARIRRRRLEDELAGAVKGMKFERATQLRDILFPGSPALYVVWHGEHNLYHRNGFCGYTSDRSEAGKFTAEEVRGWDAAPNKVIALEAVREAA